MIGLFLSLILVVALFFIRDENIKMKNELRHIASADNIHLSDDIMEIIK